MIQINRLINIWISLIIWELLEFLLFFLKNEFISYEINFSLTMLINIYILYILRNIFSSPLQLVIFFFYDDN